MVIYQLSHPGFLSWIVTHRFTEYQDQEAVLITDDFDPMDHHISLGGYMKKNNEAMKKSFVSSGVFSDILFADHVRVTGEDESGIIDILTKRYDDFFNQHNIDLDTISDYIALVDGENPIGVYLTLKKIKYCLAENMANWFKYMHLPKYWELLKDNGQEEPYLKLMYEGGSICARNELVTPILYSKSDNVFDENKDVLLFDYDYARSSISDNVAAQILEAYGVDMLSAFHDNEGKKRALFVTSSLAPIIISKNYDPGHHAQNTDNYDAYHNAHQLILDYYVGEDYVVVIKPHPGAPMSVEASSKYYDINNLISEIFPVDFFCLCPEWLENKFDLVVTTGGSAAEKAEPYGKSILHIQYDAYYMYYLFHRAYIALKIIEEFKKDSKISFHFWGYEEGAAIRLVAQSKFFAKHIFPNFSSISSGVDGVNAFTSNTSYIIIPLCDLTVRTYHCLMNAPPNTLILFFDILGKFSAFKEYFSYIKLYLLQVDISKTKIKSDVLENISNTDILYVFCKNEKLRQEMLNFTCEKILPRAGIVINVSVDKDITQNESIVSYECKPANGPAPWTGTEGVIGYEAALSLNTRTLLKLLARRIIPGPLWRCMHKIKKLF